MGPIENRRKTLQNESPNWGDLVVSKPYTMSPGGSSEPFSSNSSSASIYPPDTPPTPISAASSPGRSSAHEDQLQAHSDQARELHQNTDSTIHIGASPQSDATALSSGSHSNTMPSTKGWSLSALVSQSSNFHPVQRISATARELPGVMKEFEIKGEPLVIEGFQHDPKWPQEMFTVDYFTTHAVSNEISVRNVHKWTDTKMPLSKFVHKCRSISPYAEENEQERFYGKDAECPKSWENWVQTEGVVPASLIGNGPEDLFRHLPESGSVQTLMCYLGIGDTFTPCHKDLCASSGQNLMCYTENNGSSFWFMTKGSNAVAAAKYFQALGQELDHENHVITLQELAEAPFNVYIVEQKLGDLVIVPPRSCHQVVNFGGITIKTSWSRMTLQGLSTAYHHELPLYRRVCRPETYRVKSIIHCALMAFTKELEVLLNPSLVGPRSRGNAPQIDLLANDLKELLPLFDCILVEEYEPTHSKLPRLVSDSDDETPFTCDFCGGDIFQSFFECRECTDGGPSSGNFLHICPGCYSEGRSCKCPHMQPMQYRDFQELIATRSKTEQVIRLYEERRGQTYILNLDLKNASVPALFRAAFFLNQIRKNARKDTRVCTIYKANETPHECQFHWVLSCKKCHFGKCFSHIIMDYKIHSVEALLIRLSDKTHDAYHRIHQHGKTRFEEDKRSLEVRMKRGSRSVSYSQLVYNSINFVHCKPVSPRFMELGWYDHKDQTLEDAEDLISSSLQFPVSTSSDEMAVVEDMVHPQPTDDVTSNSDEMLVDDPPTPARKPSVYVLIPKAPYSTRPTCNQNIGESTVGNPVKKATPPKPSNSQCRPSLQTDQESTEPMVAPVSAPGPSSSQNRRSPQIPVIIHSRPSGYQSGRALQLSEKEVTPPLVAAASLASGSRPGQRAIKPKVGFTPPITSTPVEIPNIGTSKKSLANLRFKKVRTGGQSHESRPEGLNDSASQHASSSSPIPPAIRKPSDAHRPIPQGQHQPSVLFGPPVILTSEQSSTLIQPPVMKTIDAHPAVLQGQNQPFVIFSPPFGSPPDQSSAPTHPPIIIKTIDGHSSVPQGQDRPLDTFSSHPGFSPDQASTSTPINPNALPPVPQGGFLFVYGIGTFMGALELIANEFGTDRILPGQYPPNAQAYQVQMDQLMHMGYAPYGYSDTRYGGSPGQPPRGPNVKMGPQDKGGRGHGSQAASPNHKRRYPDETHGTQGYDRPHTNGRFRQDQSRRGYYPPNKRSRHHHHQPYSPPHSTGTGNVQYQRLSWDREPTDHDSYGYHTPRDEYNRYMEYHQIPRDYIPNPPVARSVPGQTNGHATHIEFNISRPVQGVNPKAAVDVSPETPRREQWSRPANGSERIVTRETLADPSGDSEMRTPTNDLITVSDDDDVTFPEPRNDLETSLPSGERADLEETVPTQDRDDSEMRPQTHEQDWESNYEQPDEHDEPPRRIFRTDGITPVRTGDEDEVSLDYDDDELRANPWA